MEESRQKFFSLQKWPGDIDQRRAYVDPIFSGIARRYDLMARLFSLGMVHRWKRETVAMISGKHPKRILDLASGTGDFAVHLRRAGFEAPIFGLDRSLPMLAVAREKCSALPRLAFMAGDLGSLPVKERAFDVITMGYGLRYPANIRSVLGEILRLLDSGSVFVAMDFGLPKNLLYRKICFGYLLGFGSNVGLLLHGNAKTYWHIVESLKVYPGQEAVKRWLEEAGLEATRADGTVVFVESERRPITG